MAAKQTPGGWPLRTLPGVHQGRDALSRRANHVRGAATVRVHVPMPQAEVYEALSDPLRRPDWIRDLKRVMPGVRGVDHWVMHGPVGAMMWDVEQTIHRAPHSLAWCMSADEGSGFMRFDLAQFGGRTRITASRQFWFRPWAKPFQQWWGDPGLRLQGDVSHLVEMLRSGPGPQVNAVGFRPTAARTSRDP